MVSKGLLSGHYVASVHKASVISSVGFTDYYIRGNLLMSSTQVFMERLYNKLGLPIKCYPRRGKPFVATRLIVQSNSPATMPLEVWRKHSSTSDFTLGGTTSTSSARGPIKATERTYAMLG